MYHSACFVHSPGGTYAEVAGFDNLPYPEYDANDGTFTVEEPGEFGYQKYLIMEDESVYRIPNPQYNESANSVKYLSALTSGGGIVDVQGRALQGLKVNIISSNKTIYAIIKFENSKWTSTIYEG